MTYWKFLSVHFSNELESRMFFGKLVYFTLLHLVANQLQINLDQTDVVSPSDALQHDCLQVATRLIARFKHYQIISYCMSESPSKWNIKINPYDQNFTFAELAKRNITSQQLYHWSAPMNIIEDYQFYLDQSSISSQIYIYKEECLSVCLSVCLFFMHSVPVSASATKLYMPHPIILGEVKRGSAPPRGG